jgi:hypothetical protein
LINACEVVGGPGLELDDDAVEVGASGGGGNGDGSIGGRWRQVAIGNGGRRRRLVAAALPARAQLPARISSGSRAAGRSRWSDIQRTSSEVAL